MAVIPDTHNTGLTPTQIDTAFSNALTHVPSTATPAMDGTASAGESDEFARGDHVHPTDTSRQAALSVVDTTVILGTDNTDISWTHSNSGIYYSNDIAVSGISTVYAVSIKGFIALTQTDVIQPMISSDGTKIRFLSNVNTFDSHDTSLIVRVIGIN